MNQIPDDSHYNAEPEECCDDWRVCTCENCQGLREDYVDMQYERKRDEEFDK